MRFKGPLFDDRPRHHTTAHCRLGQCALAAVESGVAARARAEDARLLLAGLVVVDVAHLGQLAAHHARGRASDPRAAEAVAQAVLFKLAEMNRNKGLQGRDGRLDSTGRRA
jgi:hypothetical protein